MMLSATPNRYSPNLQIAVWKMLRAGVPSQTIISTLGLTAHDLSMLRPSARIAKAADNSPCSSLRLIPCESDDHSIG